MDIPVDQLARADQELAQADTSLDILVELRREAELAYGLMGFDRVRKVAETMAALMPHATASGLLSLLAIAVERLAERTR